MSRCRRSGREQGLTLIELVLTLSILAFAGALVAGALATGLRAWQTGLRSGREELVARIVLERIAAQLRAAVASPARREGAAAVAFDAGEDHLRFVTLAGAGLAPVAVDYGLRANGGEATLVYREYPWPDKDFFSEGTPRREEQVEEISGFSVTVRKRSENADTDRPAADETTVVEEWRPHDRALPGSVSIAITVSAAGAPEPRQYRMTVAIPTRQDR